MRDLDRRRRMWDEEKTIQKRIADLRGRISDDSLRRRLDGVSKKLQDSVSWLGNLVNDHDRQEAEERKLFESVELMFSSSLHEIGDVELLGSAKPCPTCGKTMRFVHGQSASFVGPGGLPQLTPNRWECDCGYSEEAPE